MDSPLDFSPDFASGPIDFESLVYSENGIRLQLSRNLSTTILTLEEGDTGLVRQYRLTTQNQAGDTFYFRCSKCESLSKKTGTNYRPKITVSKNFKKKILAKFPSSCRTRTFEFKIYRKSPTLIKKFFLCNTCLEHATGPRNVE